MPFCSDGSRISESLILSRYSVSIREKHDGRQSGFICRACEAEQAVDNCHIIAKARLKELHKAELIYHPHAYFDACRLCHNEWEDFKKGQWIYQKNVLESLAWLKEHDPEGFRIRVNFTVLHLSEEIKKII